MNLLPKNASATPVTSGASSSRIVMTVFLMATLASLLPNYSRHVSPPHRAHRQCIWFGLSDYSATASAVGNRDSARRRARGCWSSGRCDKNPASCELRFLAIEPKRFGHFFVPFLSTDVRAENLPIALREERLATFLALLHRICLYTFIECLSSPLCRIV